MNVDASAKRYWPLIVCTMIGIAAYFQASAIGSLISASIGGGAHVPSPSSARPRELQEATNTASPILDRNPFDSSTTIRDPPALEQGAEPGPSSGLSECTSGRVVLIAQNDDPNWAFASIDDGSGQAQMRRVGDSFGKFQMMSLSWDRVYLTESGKDCFLTMGNALPTGRSTAAASDAAASDKGDIADRITKVSDTEFTMDRETIDEILGSAGGLLGKTRTTPVKTGDRVTGLRLGTVSPGSTLGHLGMKTRDVLQSMSGIALTSPEKLLTAYEKMRAAQTFNLRILRKGVSRQIRFRIR